MARASAKTLSVMCRRIGESLEAGLDVRRVVTSEGGKGNAAHRDVFRRISAQIEVGNSLAESFRESGEYFPLVVREMVDAGEKTGRLDAVFIQLADHYEHVVSQRGMFYKAIAWPVIQLFAGIVIIGALIFILAMISDFDVLGLNWVVSGVGISPGPVVNLCSYLGVVGLLGGMIGLPLYAAGRGWFGTTPIRIAYSLPLVGHALQTLPLARMAWAMAMANDAGMGAREMVSLGIRSTGNLCFLGHAQRVDDDLMRRMQVHEALRNTHAYPEDFLDVVEHGETTGMLAESLNHLATRYRKRAQSTSGILTIICGFLVWSFVAVVMIAMIFRLFFLLYLGPMYDAMQPI